MIHSMTGFANASGEFAQTRINLELRAVNHRYLDIQFKAPEDIRSLEGTMREAINKHAYRGKIECRVHINVLRDQQTELRYNQELIGNLSHLNKTLLSQHPELQPLSVSEILRFPGVLSESSIDQEAINEAVLGLLNQALGDFEQSRAREGEGLKQHILTRLEQMEAVMSNIEGLLPSLVAQHIQKAEERLREAVATIEDDRLKQEFAIFMQKADVDEELSRLKSHIKEVRRTVSGKGSAGKRLDFLMQELNREANTLGSKAIATECTQASVELKVLIEQMREQVQNIE